MNIEIWKTQTNFAEWEKILQMNKKYEIDCNKIDKNDHIYKICNFHAQQNSIDLDNKFINIMLSNEEHNGIIFDKKNKKHPLISIIYILNENGNYIFTNINNDSYNYKEINDDHVFVLANPLANEHLIFDSSKWFSIINKCVSEKVEYVLLNICDYKSSIATSDFTSLITIDNIIFNNCSNVTNAENNNKKIISEFLYDDDNENTLKLCQEIINNSQNNIVMMINNFEKINCHEVLYKKYGKLADELFSIISETSSEISETNRFKACKIIKNILSKDVCYWIINECEKKEGFVESKYANYNKCISIENIPSVMNYLLFIMNYWLMKISEIYNLENTKFFNIKEMFISKSEKDTNQQNVFNCDKTFLTLNVAINDPIDHNNSPLVFDDTSMTLLQGDMIIYNGKKMRTNDGIIKGEKYTLVVYLELNV